MACWRKTLPDVFRFSKIVPKLCHFGQFYVGVLNGKKKKEKGAERG